MCEHLSKIPKIELLVSAKSHDDSWKNMIRGGFGDYLYFTCNICNEYKEQMSHHCYFLKCKICNRLICNNCQSVITYNMIKQFNDLVCHNEKYICEFNHVHCRKCDIYSCSKCKTVFIDCSVNKPNIVELFGDLFCDNCSLDILTSH